MLFKVSKNPTEIREEVKLITGKEFNFFERIKLNIYGSPKYQLIDIKPQKYNINIQDYTDNVFVSIDTRKKGLAIYFRYINEEYISASNFNQITYISNDETFEVQTDKHLFKMKILNKKQHLKFIKQFLRIKTNFN